MPNMRIIHTNVIDSVTNLTSAPACVSTAPITNIQLPQRGKVARIVGATSWTISGQTYGNVSSLCLVGHNLTGGATVRLRLYSDLAMTVQVYDSTALAVGTPQVWGNPASSPNGGLAWGVSPWMSTGLLPGTPEYWSLWYTLVTTAVAFKIDIADAGNADGFLQIGRIYMGVYWSPVINDDYGRAMAWKEASKLSRTDGGSLRTEGYLPYRIFSCSFKSLAETDRSALLDIFRKIGMRTDVVVSFNPSAGGNLERDYLAAVKFTTLPKLTSPYPSSYESAAEMEEI
jgi:hypothetical protein